MAFQYRLSSLFLATGIVCALLAAANRLAVAYEVTVGTVFLLFVLGFIVWAFFGSFVGLAWAIHRTGSLRKSLGCIVWPGMAVGIVTSVMLTAKVPIQYLGYVVGVLLALVIAYAAFSIRYRQSASSSAQGKVHGTPAKSTSDDFSANKLRPRRFSILMMSLLVFASGCGLLWVIFGDIPALSPTKTFFVALDEPIEVPVGTPVYKLDIVIGHVKGLEHLPSGVGQIMQIEIFDDIPLYRNEECLISLDRERLLYRIELTDTGTFIGLDALSDQDVIRGHVR